MKNKWSSNIGETWKCINDRNFVCGGCDWTGFDYRGESGDFPACVCNFGAMDLCGFPKGSFYWHKVIWDSSPQVYLSSYWEYEESQTVSIACYSNCNCNAEQTDRVRLFHGCTQLAVCGSDTVEITFFLIRYSISREIFSAYPSIFLTYVTQ